MGRSSQRRRGHRPAVPAALGGCLLSGLLLTGCAAPGREAPALTRSPAPTGWVSGSGPHPAAAQSRWDDRSRAAAVACAESALGDYTRRGVSRAVWWALLAPQLSVTATTAVRDSDPALIPATTIRGKGRIVVASPDGDVAVVQIPTRTGPYQVAVSRYGPTRWLADRFTPPPHEGI